MIAVIPGAPPASVLDLNADEVRVVAAYRRMDNEARSDMLAFSESTAVAHPRRSAPLLRLIKRIQQ